MKTVIKSIVRFMLICYVAVSSIATVHAFPSFSDQSDMAQTEQILSMSEKMQPNCHQNIDKSSDTTSVSLCELFCAAMGNVISHEIFIDADLVHPAQGINSLTQAFTSFQITVEPHPPK
jgi:hypothetical protein